VKVLVIHNSYRYPGGEDTVAQAEVRLLRHHGVRVEQLMTSNRQVLERGWRATLWALWRSSFNRRVFDEVRALCRRVRPDVVHVHNFWFSLSPSVHPACHAEGVPTVQTLHNFRLFCVNGLLMRDGKPCERCVGRGPWPGVRGRCYRNSMTQSALVARMIRRNQRRGMWTSGITFVALTEFSRRRFISGGLPRERIIVKPNFVEDPGTPSAPGTGAVFIGRLSAEKGLETLLSGWRMTQNVPLAILGDGPLRPVLERRTKQDPLAGVLLRGHQGRAICLQTIQAAAFLILPSEWYETFGLTIVESFACGRPVIASRLGAMAELVADGRTGLLFEPGNASDLAAKVRWMVAHPEACREMGLAARREYEEKYSPERNYEMLMGIYESAIRNFEERSRSVT